MAAVAGIEHGIGEILQGNVPPAGFLIQSWAGSELFSILAGEPALTLIPNLPISGAVTVLLSLIFLLWVTLFIDRKHGGLVVIGLSLLLLLVGGGFGPPLLGIILGIAATRIGAPLAWWQAHLPRGLRRLLSRLWPWLLGAGLMAWLFMFPGSIMLDHFVGIKNPELTIYGAGLTAFTLLFLTIVAAFARDIERNPAPTVEPALRVT